MFIAAVYKIIATAIASRRMQKYGKRWFLLCAKKLHQRHYLYIFYILCLQRESNYKHFH